MVGIWDILISRRYHNKPLGPISSADFVDLEEAASAHMMSAFLGGEDKNRHQVIKMSMGRMLSHIWCHFEKAEEAQAPKLLLYSGHDWTVMPLRMAFEPHYGSHSSPEGTVAEKWSWTPYAGDITIELFRNEESGERFVRLLFGGIPMILNHLDADADGLCRYEKVQAYLEPYFIRSKEDLKNACFENDTDSVTTSERMVSSESMPHHTKASFTV